MKKEKLVIKSNYLVTASYKLTTVEQKFVLLAIAKLSRKDGWVAITASEYAQTYNTDLQNAYGQLKDAIETLANRWGTIYSEALNGPVKFRWIVAKKYNEAQGSVDIEFYSGILPYISILKEKFTQYELKHIAGMKSVYSIRFYEILSQWKNTKNSIEIPIADLRSIFEITEEYKVWSDLKKWVIDVAVKQINEHSDLTCSYTQRKTGRNVTHLTFNFDRKPEAKAATEPKTKPVIKRATKPTVQSAAPNPTGTSNEVKQALRELLATRKKITPPEIKTKPEPPPATSSPARSLASIMNELKIGDTPINPALAPGF